MKPNGERVSADYQKTIPASYHKLVVLMLMAFCCVSVGIGIGAIAGGIAGASHDENRLAISHDPVTPDSLSAAFARVSEAVEPSVVHIKVYESGIRPHELAGSGVIVNQSGFILTNQHV